MADFNNIPADLPPGFTYTPIAPKQEPRPTVDATREFSLADLIVRNAYSYAGVICHPDEEETDAETMAIEVDDVLAAIPTSLVVDALKQALALAIPAAIRREFTRDRCDTCDTPYLRCVEKAFDAPPGTLCCGECSHKDTPVGSQRVYSLDEATALLLAVAEGGRLPGEEFDVGERVTVLPVEPCALCGEVLSIRTATVTNMPDDEDRFEVALDDPYGIHLSGDGNGRCSGRVRLVRYRADELELLDAEDEDCRSCHTSWHNCREGLDGFLSTGSDGTPAIHDEAGTCCGECTHAFTPADFGLRNITPVGLSSLLDLARERQVRGGEARNG